MHAKSNMNSIDDRASHEKESGGNKSESSNQLGRNKEEKHGREYGKVLDYTRQKHECSICQKNAPQNIH